MRVHIFCFIALASVFGSASATQNPPPTDASIHALLQATQAHKTIDAVVNQMDGMMRKSIQQAEPGKSSDAGEQKIIDDMTNQVNNLMKQELSWDKMEPMYIDLYRKTYTQKEIDDMLAFYRSPSGRSMVAKMPALMAQSMQTMQGRMATFMPQLRKISVDTNTRLQAYDANKQKAAANLPAAASSTSK